MKLLNIKSAYSYANDMYGTTISEQEFENIALNAWELIGTKHTRLYRYKGDTENKILELPCNVDVIESVHLPINDAQISTSISDEIEFSNIYAERYIEAFRKFEDPYYQKGKFVKYKEVDGGIAFSKDYKNVTVVYHGVEVDEDGLPLINDKEMRAIAAYVAFATLYKEGLKKKDGGIIQMAQIIKADWTQLCNAARIPTHLSQNDMDSILDVRTRWDRKIFNKSYRSIL